MKPIHSLAALALCPLIAGPVSGNPRRICTVCAPPVKVIQAPQKVVTNSFREKITVIEKPVFVREAVSYLATILPASTYNISTNITTPQPQQVGFQVGVAQAGYSYGYGQGQQQAVTYDRQQQTNGQPQQAPQQAQQPLTTEQRLDRLEASIARLCDSFDRGGFVAPQQQQLDPKLPRGLGTCAHCHSATAAAKDGGGFVMFDRGLATFSEREVRLIGKHVRAGTMPPPGNSKGVTLTPEQRQAISDWSDKLE